ATGAGRPHPGPGRQGDGRRARAGRSLPREQTMNAALRVLADEYASALREAPADPQEAALMRAYDLGRRTLMLEGGVADLGLAHREVLAAALAGAGAREERARLTQRAADFLGEAMAPFKMVLRGYREANATLEQRVEERTAALRESEARYRDLFESAGDLIQG